MRLAKLVYLLLGVGLLMVVLMEVDLADVGARVVTVGAFGIAVVFVVYGFAFLADSVAWSLIITSLPPSPVWLRRTFMVRLAGEAFNNVIPAGGFAGEPVKAVILKRRYGVPYGEAAASIVMARTVNMVALIGFLLIGFFLMTGAEVMDTALRSAAAAGLGLLAFGTALLFALQRFRVSSWLAARFAGMRWAARAARAFAVIEDLDRRFVTFYTRHRARLVLALLLSFANWLLGMLELYLTFMFLGTPISWAEAWMIEALVQMVRAAAFFIPLGLGVQEGVLVLIAGAITGQPSVGLAAAAIKRVRELIWTTLGLAAAAFYPTKLKDST